MSKAVAALGLATVLAAAATTAQSAEPVLSLSLSAGAEYTTGKYGGDASVDETYVPVSLQLDLDRVALRLTVPYLSVRAPEWTYIDVPGGEPIIGEGDVVTTDGIGDVLASITVYDVLVSGDGNAVLDITGKIKFGTADADAGLGTGEQDYALQVDVFRFFRRFTAIGSAGYTVRGDPQGFDLQDVFYATLGGSYSVTGRVNVGAFYDYRGASFEGSDPAQELSGSMSCLVGRDGRIDFYVLTGFGDASPDWGAGLSFTASF